MKLREILRNVLCKLGSHDWNRPEPEQSSVTADPGIKRVCRNCGKREDRGGTVDKNCPECGSEMRTIGRGLELVPELPVYRRIFDGEDFF